MPTLIYKTTTPTELQAVEEFESAQTKDAEAVIG